MNYYNKEEQEKAARATIDDYRGTAALFSAVKPVIYQFDEKMYNKRFTDALKAALPDIGIYSEKRYNHIEINACLPGGKWHCIAKQDIKEEVRPRINADVMIEDAASRRADFLKRSSDIEKSLDKIDGVKHQIETLKTALDGITGALSCEIKDIFGLNYRITNY